MLTNAVAVLNGKGGVGKSTTASHLAGIAAAQGWRTLVVDCDGQANLHRCLGYPFDNGEHLRDALLGKTPLSPRRDRRENLSYVGGGELVDEAARTLAAGAAGGNPSANFCLDETLAPVAGDYDLIVIDSPPRELFLRMLILMASHYVVIPTDKDEAAFDGIADVMRSIGRARKYGNPALSVLSVLRWRMASSAMAGEASRTIAELLGTDSLTVKATIRSAPRAADSQRVMGLLAHEYEMRVSAAHRVTWAERLARPREEARLYSTAAGRVSEDWWAAVTEILDAFASRQRETEGALQ